MTPEVGHNLAGVLLRMDVAKRLVERAHFEAQKALKEQGFFIQRAFPPEQQDVPTGHALVAGAVAQDSFTGMGMLLRTELFMTTEADSYGCAYLSWDLRYADEGPQQSLERNATLGFKHVYEGRGTDPNGLPFTAQQELLRSLDAPMSGPTALDFSSLAQTFAGSVAADLVL